MHAIKSRCNMDTVALAIYGSAAATTAGITYVTKTGSPVSGAIAGAVGTMLAPTIGAYMPASLQSNGYAANATGAALAGAGTWAASQMVLKGENFSMNSAYFKELAIVGAASGVAYIVSMQVAAYIAAGAVSSLLAK